MKAFVTHYPQQYRQQGVALITALLIAALVTVAAVAMASRQQLDIRRTGNMLEADQAYLYALAGEAWAEQMLLEDKKTAAETDTLTEDWATEIPPLPVEGGTVSGKLEDLQGRFNLNNLLDNQGKADAKQVKILQSLLSQVSQAEEEVQLSPFIANRIVDWIDADLNASADGAEDLDYLNAAVPYRAANQFMVSNTELAAIAGFSPKAAVALSPLVTCLPEVTKVNVNTAPEMVLMGLHENITPSIASELVEYRQDKPFEDANQFVKKLKDDYEIELDPQFIDVKTEYFLLSVNAAIGRTELRMYSLLARKGNKVSAIRRSLGTL